MPGTQAEAERKAICALVWEQRQNPLDVGVGMERRQAQAVLQELDFPSADSAGAWSFYKRAPQSICVFLFLGETG